jgi:hypothetical protein
VSCLRVLARARSVRRTTGALKFTADAADPADRSSANHLSRRPGSTPRFAPDCSPSLDHDGANEFQSLKPSNQLALSTPDPPSPKDRLVGSESRPSAMRFHAKYVSVGASVGDYFAVSFDNEAPSNDDFEQLDDQAPYLIVQRQFEDDDGGICYIETHDHDTYSGHFRLRLIRFTPTCFAFEIARKNHQYVEVTYDLDMQRFDEVRRIVHIIFGVQG